MQLTPNDDRLAAALGDLGQNLFERHLAIQRSGKDLAELEGLRGG
jgi:hypothetical protein